MTVSSEPGGPVWVNASWLLIRGLHRIGRSEDAARLRRSTSGLIDRDDLHECHDAIDGRGPGNDRPTWSTALVLDLVVRS